MQLEICISLNRKHDENKMQQESMKLFIMEVVWFTIIEEIRVR